ncbi:uncharacterized protein PAF06_007146, partial [Gastrophryne carolinensis]
HSHLLSLSLLLLAAGDIAQNPGPFPSPPRSSTPHNSSQTSLHHGSKPANTRNLANLLTITPSPRTPPIVTCALWNARSVCNKLAYIHDLFTTNLFTFMAFTETWLTPSDTASPAALSYGGLQFSHTPRSTNKQGGGVGILLSEYCSFNPIPALPSLTFPSFEVHCVRLYSPCRLNIAIIYRPPGPATLFLDHFSTWLLHFLSSDIPTIIMGDFNIPVDTNNPATTKLLSLTTSFGLKQWSTSSTHKDGHTLDLLFTHLCSVSSVSSSPLPLSDHNLLTLTLTSLNTAPPAYKPAILRRNLRNLDLQSLSDALHPLHTLPSFTNVDAAASYYHNTLTAALDSVAPLNYSRPQAKKRQPWLNTNTATLKRHSRVAERHWRKSKTKEDFLLYKKALQELRTALSSAKQEYFTSLISAQARNPKQLFNTFNSLLRPPPPPPSSQLTAEQFATYFKDKIDQIRSGFTPQNTSLLPTSPLSHSLTHFTVLTAQGVSSLVSKAHLTTCSLDPIPSHLIPQLSPSVIPALTSLFNLSLSTDLTMPAKKASRKLAPAKERHERRAERHGESSSRPTTRSHKASGHLHTTRSSSCHMKDTLGHTPAHSKSASTKKAKEHSSKKKAPRPSTSKSQGSTSTKGKGKARARSPSPPTTPSPGPSQCQESNVESPESPGSSTAVTSWCSQPMTPSPHASPAQSMPESNISPQDQNPFPNQSRVENSVNQVHLPPRLEGEMTPEHSWRILTVIREKYSEFPWTGEA